MQMKLFTADQYDAVAKRFEDKLREASPIPYWRVLRAEDVAPDPETFHRSMKYEFVYECMLTINQRAWVFRGRIDVEVTLRMLHNEAGMLGYVLADASRGLSKHLFYP